MTVSQEYCWNSLWSSPVFISSQLHLELVVGTRICRDVVTFLHNCVCLWFLHQVLKWLQRVGWSLTIELWVSTYKLTEMATMQYHQQQQQQQRYYNTLGGQSSSGNRPPTMQRRPKTQGQEDGPTPICRCRVLYLGSAVPQVTKDGLQGIQVNICECCWSFYFALCRCFDDGFNDFTRITMLLCKNCRNPWGSFIPREERWALKESTLGYLFGAMVCC